MIRAKPFITPILFIFAASSPVALGDEVAFFDNRGKAVAYFDMDDGLAIYLWGGQPVAYLDDRSHERYHVYGFNGQHLGWFEAGILYDHKGDAACAFKAAMRNTLSETFKGFKQFEPFKAHKEFPPIAPTFSDTFGSTSCRILLGSGFSD
ncbi:MAG: hypothetical protein K9L32_04840 [Chromatiaceae bacterium]|nr:hypothetical protein [Chromatiaceae bacterium]